jgi:hypothetical protein
MYVLINCNPSNESKISSDLKTYYYENFQAYTEYKMLMNTKTKRWLRCDIYIPHGKDPRLNGFYIEIHGSQHYVNNGFFFTNNKEFKYRLQLDEMKKSFAVQNGYYIEVDLRKIKQTEDAIKYINEQLLKAF